MDLGVFLATGLTLGRSKASMARDSTGQAIIPGDIQPAAAQVADCEGGWGIEQAIIPGDIQPAAAQVADCEDGWGMDPRAYYTG